MCRVALAIAMSTAGVAHFVTPLPFVQHLPEWIPHRTPIIYATGVAELGLAAGLLAPARWRPVAGGLLAAYLVAVFPANVYVAVFGVEVAGHSGGLYPWFRLPFQPVLVWLVLWSSGTLDLWVRVRAEAREGAGGSLPERSRRLFQLLVSTDSSVESRLA